LCKKIKALEIIVGVLAGIQTKHLPNRVTIFTSSATSHDKRCILHGKLEKVPQVSIAIFLNFLSNCIWSGKVTGNKITA
jgi:hypothetical protein